MNNNPMFSIIIPVYKVEKYLDACVKSVIAQKKLNFEAILIDDGSPDNCGKICDEYAEKYPFIKVIHQENSGLSAARNAGINAACGDYIVLLDSDDMLFPEALSDFENAISLEKGDIYAGYPLCLMEADGSTCERFSRRKLNSGSMSGREFLETCFSQGTLEATAQFNVYNRKFLLNNQLYFKNGILHEDERWTPEVFLKAQKVIEVDSTFYIYRLRPDSITTSKKSKVKNALDVMQTCYELESISQDYAPKEVKWLCNHLAMIYMSAVFDGRMDQYAEANIKRTFPIRNAHSIKNTMKSVVFLISPKLYCSLDSILKTQYYKHV